MFVRVKRRVRLLRILARHMSSLIKQENHVKTYKIYINFGDSYGHFCYHYGFYRIVRIFATQYWKVSWNTSIFLLCNLKTLFRSVSTETKKIDIKIPSWILRKYNFRHSNYTVHWWLRQAYFNKSVPRS